MRVGRRPFRASGRLCGQQKMDDRNSGESGGASRGRRRRAGIDARMLIRAQARPFVSDENAEAAARGFDAAFPLPPESEVAELWLTEWKAEHAAGAERRAKRAVRPHAHGMRPQPLAVRLRALIRSALEDAVERMNGADQLQFALIPLNPVRIVLALSGGRDSMAMLDVLSRLRADARQAIAGEVCAVYVHHGLSPHAAQWEEHCRKACEARGVGFESIRVQVRNTGEGIEAAARSARYRALADFALRGGYDVVMTAHHEDDRIETFLMQWMRGSGLEGLAAFPKTRSLEASAFVHGRRTPGTVLLLRPWIGVSRAEIDRYVHNRRIAYVNDESNDDPRYLRNRVRHEIVPILEAVRPGFRQGAVRSINLVSEALDVLKSVAAGDLEACRSGAVEGGLSVVQLLRLIPSRQSWCLRAWLQSRGLSAPPKRKLDEALRQIREAGSETNFCLRVQGREIRRWGGDLVLCEAKGAASSRESVTTLRWTGEDMPIPGWDGTIRVVPCGPDEPGIALERLEAPNARLEVRSRRGSVKLKLWALRPAKPLKDLYAQAGIPAYARADLPVLWLDGEPVFAAGLGIDVRAMSIEGESARRVRFVFAPQKSLWDVQVLPNYADVPEDERRAREAKLKAAAKQFEKNARARRARAAS